MKRILVTSYKIKSMFDEVLSDAFCPDDRLFIVDENGDVHYFKYLGRNLAGIAGEQSE